MKIHYRDLRLYVNAGMAFPECYVSAGPLDTDKSRLPTTTDVLAITCKVCRAAHASDILRERGDV